LPIFVIVLLLVIIINEKDLPNATTILYSVCLEAEEIYFQTMYIKQFAVVVASECSSRDRLSL